MDTSQNTILKIDYFEGNFKISTDLTNSLVQNTIVNNGNTYQNNWVVAISNGLDLATLICANKYDYVIQNQLSDFDKFSLSKTPNRNVLFNFDFESNIDYAKKLSTLLTNIATRQMTGEIEFKITLIIDDVSTNLMSFILMQKSIRDCFILSDDSKINCILLSDLDDAEINSEIIENSRKYRINTDSDDNEAES